MGYTFLNLLDEMRMMVGEFPSVEEESKLALRYVYETERFDRMVCSVIEPETGTARPVYTGEYKAINRNAKRLHRELMRELEVRGLDHKAYLQERDRWGRMAFQDLEEHYKRTFNP